MRISKEERFGGIVALIVLIMLGLMWKLALFGTVISWVIS